MRLKRWDIFGAILVIAAGFLLHFVFEWSGNNSIVGIFSAVNESVWEHIKLLFWPMFFYSIAEFFAVGKDYPCFIPARVKAVFIGSLLIPVLYYTYSGIIGTHFLVADILIFIISIILSFYISFKLTVSNECYGNVILSLIAIAALAVCFIVFTFSPPHIGLFLDSQTLTYGIPK